MRPATSKSEILRLTVRRLIEASARSALDEREASRGTAEAGFNPLELFSSNCLGMG